MVGAPGKVGRMSFLHRSYLPRGGGLLGMVTLRPGHRRASAEVGLGSLRSLLIVIGHFLLRQKLLEHDIASPGAHPNSVLVQKSFDFSNDTLDSRFLKSALSLAHRGLEIVDFLGCHANLLAQSQQRARCHERAINSFRIR